MRTETDTPRSADTRRSVDTWRSNLTGAASALVHTGATEPSRPRLGMAFRAVAAAGVLLSADVHLELWATGFKEIDTIGPLFMLNAIGGFVIGVAVLVWRHWLTLFLAAGFGVATLVAFYISATVGLFGLQETLGGVQQVTAEIAEYVAIAGAIAAFAAEWPRRPARL
jgi:hypothetical protein